MLKDAYRKQGLAPENLSRTLEDTGTVTSVLIPWNTCGVAQSGILGISTWTYLPYCIFNLVSPLMTLTIAAIGYHIRKTDATSDSY
jgi:NhaC family Na+:H+ antiporter